MSGDGCSASCECEQNPCAFSVGASVEIDSVISRLRGGSSLTLLAGTFGCGWRVWSALGEDQRPITIRGQGPSNTVVDCDHATPVVESVINGTRVRLSGISFVNARRSGSGGSVVRAVGDSEVEMENCRVTNCSADGDGGAVSVSRGNLVVRRSHFEGNSAADRGGALAIVDGTCTLTDSTFRHCFAAHGGGSYVARTKLVLEGCLFLFNHADGFRGGGLFAELGSMINVSSTIFEGNIGFHGGGISVKDGCLLGLTAGVRLEANMGSWGGGLSSEVGCTVEMSDGVKFVRNIGTKRFCENPFACFTAPIIGGNFMAMGYVIFMCAPAPARKARAVLAFSVCCVQHVAHNALPYPDHFVGQMIR